MQTYRKKKIEIIIEAPLLRRIVERLDSLRIGGYSVLPVIAGNGQGGRWEATGLVGDAGRVVAIMCIIDPPDVDRLLDDVFPLIQRQIGIVAISDVEVIRPEHF